MDDKIEILECVDCGWMGREDLADRGTADGRTEVLLCPECEGFLEITMDLEVVPITPAGLHELLENELGE
ncbi:MAG: hypothetical protein KAR39_12820 [Thermoplasmata archaeon]|nr:hypothetical protein [Thermoplasmata archaeon]